MTHRPPIGVAGLLSCLVLTAAGASAAQTVDQRLGDGRFRVASAATSPQAALDAALRRAAQLSLSQGSERFAVLAWRDGAPPLGPRFSVGKGARPLEAFGGLETGLAGGGAYRVVLDVGLGAAASPSAATYDARALTAAR